MIINEDQIIEDHDSVANYLRDNALSLLAMQQLKNKKTKGFQGKSQTKKLKMCLLRDGYIIKKDKGQ